MAIGIFSHSSQQENLSNVHKNTQKRYRIFKPQHRKKMEKFVRALQTVLDSQGMVKCTAARFFPTEDSRQKMSHHTMRRTLTYLERKRFYNKFTWIFQPLVFDLPSDGSHVQARWRIRFKLQIPVNYIKLKLIELAIKLYQGF